MAITSTKLEPQLSEKQKCTLSGGKWENGVCIPKGSIKLEDGSIVALPPKPAEKPDPVDVKIKRPEAFSGGSGVVLPTKEDPNFDPNVGPVKKRIDTDTGEQLPVGNIPQDRTFLGLGGDDVSRITGGPASGVGGVGGVLPVGTQQAQATQAAENQALAGQVGRIGSSVGQTPFAVDQEEMFKQAAIGSIPSTIRSAGTLAGGALLLGGRGAAAGAAAGPGGIAVGAAIGAAVGLVAGISSGMISNTKQQRTDNANQQQRVLDEGKQTLKDWATMAKANPSLKEFYLAQFNIQLQKIQDAHRQLLLDTNSDAGKFESAIPNLAEFNAFFSLGGERDALIQEMRNSLLTPANPEYDMLELTHRMS